MQTELDGESTTVPIDLIGIGEAGTGSNNANFTDGRSIPWLQDDAQTDAWGEWGANKYELILVDATGTVVEVINLSQNNLVNSTNFDAVKQRLIDLANGT